MKGQHPKMTNKSWSKLTALAEKQGPVKLADLSRELGLDEEKALSYLKDIFLEGKGINFFEEEDEAWVDIDADSLQFILPLSLSELIEIHHFLSVMPNQYVVNHSTLAAIQQKILENSPIKVVMELLNQLDQCDVQSYEKQKEIIQVLDLAVAGQQLVQLTIENGRSYVVHPRRVLHLEGKLSLVAEDSQDHCLTVIDLNDISKASALESLSSHKASSFEVEEFIAAIRSMNEKETRLIIKIHDHQSVNLFPHHQFLGKPCMVTNPNGDLIWAAYVEPCDALYEWLMELGKNVEILDPVKFKEEYLTYCEEKLNKIA